MKKRHTEDLILLFFALLGILVVVLTFVNFCIHGHVSYFGEINVDKLSAFGGFVGGIVGTIFSATATILVWMALKTQQTDLAETKKLTQMQIDMSIRPDLFLLDMTKEMVIQILESGMINITRKDSDDLNFRIPIINIGIGAARQVTLCWKFKEAQFGNAVLEKIKLYNSENRTSLFAAPKIKLWSESETEREATYRVKFDLCLPSSQQLENMTMRIPDAYVYSILSFHLLTGSYDLPQLRCELSYHDISDKLHSKAITLTPIVVPKVWPVVSHLIENNTEFALKITASDYSEINI